MARVSMDEAKINALAERGGKSEVRVARQDVNDTVQGGKTVSRSEDLLVGQNAGLPGPDRTCENSVLHVPPKVEPPDVATQKSNPRKDPEGSGL